MAWRFALMIDPAEPDDPRTDFNGTFSAVDPAAPALSVGELSTQRGDGIFESVGVIDGHAQEVQAHLDRLAHSAELCDLPVPNLEQWREAVAMAAEHCGLGESVIKLILSRGVDHGPAPTAWITAAPAADFSVAQGERRSRGDARSRVQQRRARARPVAAAGREDALVRGQHGGHPRSEAPRR